MPFSPNLTDQTTRAQCHDPRVDLRVFVGDQRDVYFDMSTIYAGSNIATGGATGWTDVTTSIGNTVVIDSQEHGAKLMIKGWRYNDDQFDGALRRRILVKARYGGGGTDSGWQDIFVGYLGQGGDITGIWQSSVFGETAEGEQVWLAKTLLPSHHFGPVNLAKGKTATASSTLTVPDSEYPLERFSGGAVGAAQAVDGIVFDTLWIAQNAPQLAGDYYSPWFGHYYNINEVFGHATGPNDTIDPQYVEIIAGFSANWNAAGTRNLGNIQAWDATYMPGGSPGMIGWHQNGANYTLHTADIPLPFSPFPNNQQVLRNTHAGSVIAGMLYIMNPTEGTVVPIPGWNYHIKMWWYAPLPNDGLRHYIKYRLGDHGQWKFVQITGAWQLIDDDADAFTVNNAADSLWGFQMYAWSSSDSAGHADTSIAYMDFARLQIIQGAPIAADYNAALGVGLGTLRLKVRDHTGALLNDIDLSRYPTQKTKGLQSIIVTPARQPLEAQFTNLGATGAIIVDCNDLFPGVWLDASAFATTLVGALNATATTIPVLSTTGFTASGTIVIDAGGGWQEVVPYTGVAGNTFTGCTRVGTITHLNGAPVGQRTAIASLELYSAAYIDPNRGGGTLVPLKTHDIITLNNAAPAATTAYASYSTAYPTNGSYSYQRSPGIFGGFATNIYPSPGTPSMGSTREVIMVDLGTFPYATLTNSIGTADTSFEVAGDPSHVPVNGYIRVGTGPYEYMLVAAVSGTTVNVTRNVTVPSTPPTSGTLAVHNAGDNLIPMLPDILPATTWHPQQNNRVAAVVLARKDGMAPIVDATVMYATASPNIPTDEYTPSGWTVFRRVSANSASQIVLLAPGNNGTPPSYPPTPSFFNDPALVGLEARRIAVIINHMAVRPDGTGVGDRAKMNELIVYERPTNSGVGGNYQDTTAANLKEIFGHLWCQDYGNSTAHPPAEMNARYHPSQSFSYVGLPVTDLSVTQNTYSSVIQQLCDLAGLDWWVDEWGAFNVGFHRHSGLGLPPGSQPVIDFNRSFVRQAGIKGLQQLQTAQVKLTGTDYTGRRFQALYPSSPNKSGKIDTVTVQGVISQTALDRMARARYNSENRRWDVVVTLGICEYLLLQRGQLVTFTWLIGNGVEQFQGKVMVVASWQQTFINKESAWELTTTCKLEEKNLI